MIVAFYNLIFVPIASIFLLFLKFFNKKASERENRSIDLIRQLLKIKKNKFRIWFHSSSMGEFEQAKPLIEKFKASIDCEIICSFFSPSGYNNQKEYPLADFVCYMPFDSKSNAELFVSAINPDIAFFVRYDLWLNHLNFLKNQRIKTYLINATKPSNSLINFPIIKEYYKFCFNIFETIFTVDEIQTNYFSSLKIVSKIITTSDTRLDRISEQVTLAKSKPIFDPAIFVADFVIVAGSVWLTDEKYLSKSIQKIREMGVNVKVIYVPHEPTEKNLNELIELVPNYILLSEILNNKNSINIESDIIVDSIGYLLRLYAYADLAFVGCGWGDGVHSVSEPAGYAIPVLCGPNISKMPDAINLQKIGGLIVVQDENELFEHILELLKNRNKRIEIGRISDSYISASIGSTELILNYINLTSAKAVI